MRACSLCVCGGGGRGGGGSVTLSRNFLHTACIVSVILSNIVFQSLWLSILMFTVCNITKSQIVLMHVHVLGLFIVHLWYDHDHQVHQGRGRVTALQR